LEVGTVGCCVGFEDVIVVSVHLKDIKAISVGTASNKLVDLVESDLVMIMGRLERSMCSTQSIERKTLTRDNLIHEH
jgi:hypothetical protein